MNRHAYEWLAVRNLRDHLLRRNWRRRLLRYLRRERRYNLRYRDQVAGSTRKAPTAATPNTKAIIKIPTPNLTI